MTTSYCDFILNSVANACLHQIWQGKHQTFLSRKNFANIQYVKALAKIDIVSAVKVTRKSCRPRFAGKKTPKLCCWVVYEIPR